MAKKKDKPQVINNIRELNLDIDYDKLAQAIVKAQNKADVIEEKDDDNDSNVGFWKSVWGVICNKNETHDNMLASGMTILMSTLFNALAVVSLLGGVASIYLIVASFMKFELSIAIVAALIYAGLSFFMLITALLMRGVANDLSWEKNRNYIVSVFSGIVSFAALIVALVALFKGVG